MGNVSVLLNQESSERFLATVLGLPDCQAEGITREVALANLRTLLLERLQGAEIVTLDIYDEHPLVKRSGMFKDDPQFDAMLEFIEADRRALDVATSENLHGLNSVAGNSAA